MSQVIFSQRPASSPLSFIGNGGEFLRLLFKGALLQLISVGFYRFWFITNIRRMLWSGTQIDGDSLEYTGRGKELLIGFLVALAILAPFFILYFVVTLEVERFKAFASIPLYLALYLFGQFATFRARRYRLTRTVWRGIRFWMKGSGWSYAFRSFAWMLLTVATLGLAYPWREAALERYKIGNTYFGDLRGEFQGTGWSLFKASLLIWAAGILLFGVPLGYVAAQGVLDAMEHPYDPAAFAIFAREHRLLLSLGGIAPLAMLLVWPIYQAIEWRWWLNGIRLGQISFTSRFPMSKILVLYLKYLGCIIPFLAVLFGLVTVFAIFRGNGPIAHASAPIVGPLISAGVVYLAALLVLGVLYRYYLQFRLWSAVFQTLEVNNLADVASVTARGEAANALGEGLADGLDVAGF